MNQFTAKDIKTIMKILCASLGEPENRMPSSDVYKNVKDQLDSSMEESAFRSLLSQAIKSGKLVGVGSRKGRYGGVYMEDLGAARESVGNEKIDFEPVVTPKPAVSNMDRKEVMKKAQLARAEHRANALSIKISRKWRIFPVDKLNWALQKNTGDDSWMTYGYYSTVPQALKGAVRHIIDKRLRASEKAVSSLDEMKNIIVEMEKNILNELNVKVEKAIDKREDS